MSQQQPLDITAVMPGAVRLSADLQSEESKNGAYARDIDAATARSIAFELLRAAEEADMMSATL